MTPMRQRSLTRKESDEETQCNVKTKCQKCQICVLELLHELNLLGVIYLSLYIVYKFVSTISRTQVSCEMILSVLNIIKHRLRSSLRHLLDDYVLIYVEHDCKFDYERTIGDVATSPKQLSRHLKALHDAEM